MVNKTYKRMREMGEFETVHEIFGKLPVSRIEKEQYLPLDGMLTQAGDVFMGADAAGGNQRNVLFVARILEKLAYLGHYGFKVKARVLQIGDFGCAQVAAGQALQSRWLASPDAIAAALLAYCKGTESDEQKTAMINGVMGMVVAARGLAVVDQPDGAHGIFQGAVTWAP